MGGRRTKASFRGPRAAFGSSETVAGKLSVVAPRSALAVVGWSCPRVTAAATLTATVLVDG
jgi:hypothetical protein